MTFRRKLFPPLILMAFSAVTMSAVAQTGSNQPNTMGTGQTSPSGISKDMKGQMTPDQVRDYLSERDKCGAPSAQTQSCIDGVHKKYTSVDPKCQKLYGPALTDCMQTMGKGG